MLSEKQLLQAIEETENAPATYQTCEKLAVYYTLYDKLYGLPNQEARVVGRIRSDNSSAFRSAINNKHIDDVISIIDELFSSLELLQPNLYNATLLKITDL